MTSDFTTTIIAVVLIGVISLVVGAAIGFVLSGLRAPQSPSASGGNKSQKQVEAARIWRDLRSDRIFLEFEGKIYRSRADLNARQMETLKKLHDELELWLGGDDQPDRLASVSAKPLIQEAAAVEKPQIGEQRADKLPATQKISYEASAALIEYPPEVQPPSLEVGDILARAISREAPKDAPVKAKSIVAQVDEIVQRRLPESPFAGRNIKLVDLPGGGMYVVIDGIQFAAVSDVTDLGIREFLHDCVAEWERKAAAR